MIEFYINLIDPYSWFTFTTQFSIRNNQQIDIFCYAHANMIKSACLQIGIYIRFVLYSDKYICCLHVTGFANLSLTCVTIIDNA